MNAKANEIICGEYNYQGDCIIYADTDSVDKNTIIKTNLGDFDIERLFNANKSSEL